MMPFSVPNNIVWALSGIYAILLIASLIAFFLKRASPKKSYWELIQRIKSWWVMVAIFTFAIVFSRSISLMFFAFVSFLALKEYFSIIPTRRSDRRVLFWAYVAIIFQYFWIFQGWYGMFIIFIPVYMFLFLPLRMVIIGETENFLQAAGVIHWGLMTLVFSISHIAYLIVLPGTENSGISGAGLVLYLVFLTQFNDVAQYVWGKMLGRDKIIPKVSPNKTWQGFIGGVATTILLSVLLSGMLTPLSIKMAFFPV